MMDCKYNILLVHNYYQQRGGEDSVFENEYNMLVENGHNVIKYVRNNNEIKSFNFLKKILLPFTTIFSIKTYREIKKEIKKNNIDFIHVHNTLNLISPAIFYAAKRMKVPVVQTVHNFRMLCPNGMFYREGKICEECTNKGLKCAIKNKCYRNKKLHTIINCMMLRFHRTTKIYKYINFIFLTEFNKNKFVEYNKKYRIFDENKFYVKPNFVDLNFKISNIKKKDKQFIFVGRLDESKGIKDLVLTWKELNDNKLIICGTGPLEYELKEYANTNNLNIEFKGFLEKEKLYKDIAESKALIFPSKCYEGYPMTIAEAASLGTNILCNNIGNGADITKKFNGIVYNTLDELKEIINSKSNQIKLDNIIYNKSENYNVLCNVYNDVLK